MVTEVRGAGPPGLRLFWDVHGFQASGHNFEIEWVHPFGVAVSASTPDYTLAEAASQIHSLEEELARVKQSHHVLERHLRSMTALAKRHVFTHENLPEALASITEMCALALEVQRSSVWVLVKGDTALRCLHLHDQSAHSQGAGGELPADPFPAYFQELLSGRIIAAEEAQVDPRTREFTESYLRPLDIHAMLDAPIRIHDHLVGVVCQEHTRAPRHWLREDVGFASFIAHSVSMVLEAHFRRGGTIPDFTMV